ncbi:MAG TPA: O-antigen ligase family protein [Blastocatellia bacterium]|nr:O-antigen ligase family protein [Blastocatellia bacterium]
MGEMVKALDKTMLVVLLAAVAFTALAHGAVEAWSVAVFQALTILAMLVWASKAAAQRRLRINAPSTALPIGALALLGLVQSESGLSVDAEATRYATAALFFMLLLFVAASNCLESRARLMVFSNFVVAFGLALAVFALIQHFTWNGNIYWVRPNTQGGTPFGPFVNRNHFAGYMEMIIPVPLAFVAVRSARSEARLFYAFAASVMGLSVIVSLSRGGMISLASSLVFVAAMSTWMRARSGSGHPSFMSRLLHPASVISFVGVAILAGIIWVGPDPVVKRIAQDIGQEAAQGEPKTSQASRAVIWRDTLDMVKAHPLAGVGLGAFATAYPAYSRGDGSVVIAQAHNDYLQALADAGVVGLALALWFVALVFRQVARGVKSRDPLVAALALGCGGGLFAMLVHSLVDFNLQLPSNALMFLLLSAVATHAGALATDATLKLVPKPGSNAGARRVEPVREAAPRYARGIQS